MSGSQAAFIVPNMYPVTSTNLNWTPVTVGIVLAVVLGAWFLPGCGAAHWYQGKSHTLEEFHDVVRVPSRLTRRLTTGSRG